MSKFKIKREECCPYEEFYIELNSDWFDPSVFDYQEVEITHPNGRKDKFNSIDAVFPFSEWNTLSHQVSNNQTNKVGKINTHLTGFHSIKISILPNIRIGYTFEQNDYGYLIINGRLVIYKRIEPSSVDVNQNVLNNIEAYFTIQEVSLSELPSSYHYTLKFFSVCSFIPCLKKYLKKASDIILENPLENVCNNETISKSIELIMAYKSLNIVLNDLKILNNFLEENSLIQTNIYKSEIILNRFVYINDESEKNYKTFYFSERIENQLKSISNTINNICCCLDSLC